MRLESIHVGEMRGLPQGFEVRFDEQELVLIHGPNGIGKSSLVRLVRLTLWPEGALDWEHAETRWTIGTKRWTARLSLGAVGWSCEGVETSPPPLPDPSTASSYVLRLPDLLFEKEQGEGSFARRIRVELFGGIDLDRIEAAIEVPSEKRFTMCRSEISRAKAALRKAEDGIRDAARSEQRLEEIEAELRGLTQEKTRLDHVQRTQEIRAWERKLSALEEHAAQFPDGLDELRPSDADEAKTLEHECAQAARQRDDALACLRRSEQDLRDLGVASPESQSPSDRAGLRTRLNGAKETLRDLGSSLTTLRKERAQAKVAAHGAGLAGVEEALLSLEAEEEDETLPGKLQELEHLLEHHSQLKIALEQVNQDIVNGDGLPEPEPADDLEEGVRLLQLWLSTPRPSAPRTPEAVAGRGAKDLDRLELVLLVVGLAAAGVGFLRGVPLALGFGAGISGIVALDLARRRFQPAAPTESRAGTRGDLESATGANADEFEARFASLPLGPPPVWDRPDVERRLRDLRKQLARIRLDEQRREEWTRERPAMLAKQSGLREELEQVRRLARLRVQPFGLDEEHLLDSFRVLRAIEERRSAVRAAREAALHLREIESEFGRIGERLRAFLEEEGSTVDWDAEDLPRFQSELGALETRMNALDRFDEAKRSVEETERRYAKIEQQRERFFAERSLAATPPTDRLGVLRKRVAMLDAWRKCKTERDVLRHNIGDATHRRVDAEVTTLSDEELEREITELERRQARANEISEEKGKLLGHLERVRCGQDIENALASVAEQEATLEELKEQRTLAEARLELLSELRVEIEREHAPPVLRRAVAFLHTFTAGAYELKYSARHGFIALELHSGEERPLEELSDGTRAQCLVAVRLASIATSEHGENLPVFLDEALVLSDDEREERLIRALLTLAERGSEAHRQVFYLTSQVADLDTWRRIADERGDEFLRLDLGALRGRAGAAAPEALRTPEVTPIPVPLPGESVTEYGLRVGVAPIDPHVPVEAADLWHLILDPSELALVHRLRLFSIRTIGSWRERGGEPMEGIGEAQRALLSLRSAALQHFLDLWSRGRPRPLPTAQLFACPALTETFREGARELLGDVGHDARAFVTALEEGTLKGFRKKQMREIEDWARARGMIVDSEPVSSDELLQQLLVRLGTKALDHEEEVRSLHAQWTARLSSTSPVPGEDPNPDSEATLEPSPGGETEEQTADASEHSTQPTEAP